MKNTLKHCSLPARDLPVIGTVDLIVAGATMGGLSAALKAASLGAKVFVISYQPRQNTNFEGLPAVVFFEPVW